jgi:uncharacterized membrane protein YedE/YeeE
MENFTPVSALIGGALIGLGVVVLMLANGRIAGISGIVGGAVQPDGPEWRWRVGFIVGLVGGAALAMLAGFGPASIAVTGSLPLLIGGGLLVGFGTRLGSGCTSGHGVCGLARLSPRSLAATGIFMATGAATVFVMRHVLGG